MSADATPSLGEELARLHAHPHRFFPGGWPDGEFCRICEYPEGDERHASGPEGAS